MDPSGFRQMANDWLKEFAVCLKNVSMYSSVHPRGRDSLERSKGSLEDLLRDRAPVTLTCADGHLMMENLPVDRDRAISIKIYAYLSGRNVKSIEFATGEAENPSRRAFPRRPCQIISPSRAW